MQNAKLLPGCELVFKTLSTDGRDYHSEMNSVIFNKWVEEQLVPALPPKSLVVMDNASYHSVIKEGTKTLTSATRKGDMQKWFKDKKLPLDGKMKKNKLHEIIKLKKPEPVYKTDDFFTWERS
jgi:transposase